MDVHGTAVTLFEPKLDAKVAHELVRALTQTQSIEAVGSLSDQTQFVASYQAVACLHAKALYE